MVSRKKIIRVAMALMLGYGTWAYFYEPEATIISAHIGKTFDEVAQDSTFPIKARSGGAATDMQWTYVSEPSVIIRFSAPRHGFTLPPTTFAAVTYMHGKVTSISTSPMLKPLPFDAAIELLAQLQQQFQAGGWQPWKDSDSSWFDLTPAGRQHLHEALLKRGTVRGQELIVPCKYSMIFRLYCLAGCANVPGPERYLIDVGLGNADEAPEECPNQTSPANADQL